MLLLNFLVAVFGVIGTLNDVVSVLCITVKVINITLLKIYDNIVNALIIIRNVRYSE